MGDGAVMALRAYVRGGMPIPRGPRIPRPRCSCLICRKEVEASEGLASHLEARHGIRGFIANRDAIRYRRPTNG